MEIKLTKKIIDSITNGNTSLGNHPSFPDDDEQKFAIKLLNNRFAELSEKINGTNEKEVVKLLNENIEKALEIEKTCKEALEKLCLSIVTHLFNIEENTIIFDCQLVEAIDNTSQREAPEATDDFVFDDLDDIDNLTNEIYRRRLLNSLIAGASTFYRNNISSYLKSLFKINPELPYYYSNIIKYNDYLLFYKKNRINKNVYSNDESKVEVYLSNNINKPIEIKTEGLLFPFLLEATIKGVLELAISTGMPDDYNRADFIMKKADFKLAEIWDNRFGYPLWEIIFNTLKKQEFSLKKIGLDTLFAEFSTMEYNEFIKLMKNIFAKTKYGENKLRELADYIEKDVKYQEFTNFIKIKNDKFQLNDNEYYNFAELSEKITKEANE